MTEYVISKNLTSTTNPNNDRVTCTIEGTKITDARISIDEDGRPFICQNERDGADAENKLGYKYSWATDARI